MKKLFAFIMLAGVMTFGLSNNSIAQGDTAAATTTDTTAAAPAVEEAAAPVEEEVIAAEEKTFHQVMKEKFIEGDVVWMTPVLLCLIIGLALCIERVITLNLSTTNSKKLLAKVEEALANGNIEAAKEITRNTRGPVASIFTLYRSRTAVEKLPN